MFQTIENTIIDNNVETSFACENNEEMSLAFDDILDIESFYPAVDDAEIIQPIELDDNQMDEDIGLFISETFDSDSLMGECDATVDSSYEDKTKRRIDAESFKSIQITPIQDRERTWIREEQHSLTSESPQKRYRSSLDHVGPARELQNKHNTEKKALLSQSNEAATNASTPKEELSQDRLDDLYENRLAQLAIAVKRSAASRMQVVRHRLLLSYIGL